MMDPSNLPSDNRPTIYEAINLNNQERNNQYQSNLNNPNLWKDNNQQKENIFHKMNITRIFQDLYQILMQDMQQVFKNFMA